MRASLSWTVNLTAMPEFPGFCFVPVTVDGLYPLALAPMLALIGADPLSAVISHHAHWCATLGPCAKPDACKSKFIGTPPSVPNHYTDKAPHSNNFCLSSSSHFGCPSFSLYASVHSFCSPRSFLHPREKTQRSTLAVRILNRPCT